MTRFADIDNPQNKRYMEQKKMRRGSSVVVGDKVISFRVYETLCKENGKKMVDSIISSLRNNKFPDGSVALLNLVNKLMEIKKYGR